MFFSFYIKNPTRHKTAVAQNVDFPYQRQFDLGGEGLLVVGGLDEDDDGRGHGFSHLVSPDGVALQWEVGEDHEPAEAQRQQHNSANGKVFWSENVNFLADVEPQPGDHEVNEGQGHVGEAVVHVDPLVDEDNADGGQQVDQHAGDDALLGWYAEQHLGDSSGCFLAQLNSVALH